MERNVRRYPIYVALFSAFFWMPIFFLYFGAHFSLAEILRLEAIYYISVVALEVPSGYFSDRVGRRLTLLGSAVFLSAAYLLFFFSDEFIVFAAAQLLLAAGISFNSGTDTSFHYDSLAACGRADEYDDREAIVARTALVATGISALVGGLVASYDLRLAYALSAVAALASVVVVATFREPPHDGSPPEFLPQMRNCFAHLQRPVLRWLFGFAVLATVLNHVPYEFYQPYIDLVGVDLDIGDHTAAVAGVHAASATLLASWFARRSVRLSHAIGTAKTLLLASGLQLAIIIAMGVLIHPVIVVLLLLRGLPSGLAKAPLNAAVTPRIPQRERATYLSIQSLAGRLSFAALLGGLSVFAGDAGLGDASMIGQLLLISGAVGGAAWLLLAATSFRLEDATEPTD